MLVLSRKEGEQIVIGDDIIIKVLEIHGNVVKIGFDAPKHVRIDREEVSIIRSREAAACQPPNDQRKSPST